MQVDLHVHSSSSDGLFAAEEVYTRAVEGGLSILAITDHDTISGYDRARARVPEPIGETTRLVAGVEFTTVLGSSEVHILGYFADEVAPSVRDHLREVQEDRRRRIRGGVENLNRHGVKVSWSDVEAVVEGDCVSRSHLARALVECGAVRTIGQAFRRYLAAELEIVPNPRVSVHETIELIGDAGGTSVWAHPEFDLFDEQIDTFRDFGLDGVEVFTPSTSGSRGLYLERVVEDLGLLMSGGSDWHGHAHQGSLGTFRVEGEQVGPLLERLGCRCG